MRKALLFAYPAVKQAAFNAELRNQGLNSDVIELSSERYVVLHIEEYKASEPKALDSVRTDIKLILAENKAEAAAEMKAQSLRLVLAAGGRAEDVAKQQGLTWNAIINGKRNDINIDAAVRNQAFSMPRPQSQASVSTLRKNNGDRVVLQLLDVRYGDISALKESVALEAEKNAYRDKSSQEFSAYFNNLWENAEIKIN
jgi:peptidyl-prolyl cis-trans isomerase D